MAKKQHIFIGSGRNAFAGLLVMCLPFGLMACGSGEQKTGVKSVTKQAAQEGERILASPQTDVAINDFYNIAGISIGDSPKAAYIAATSKGYVFSQRALPPGIVRSNNFEETVELVKSKDTSLNAQIKSQRKGSTWREFNFVKGYENIQVIFLLKPEGSFVKSVTYKNTDPTMSFEGLKSAAQDKFGDPAHTNPGYAALFAESGNLYNPSHKQKPHIIVQKAGVGIKGFEMILSGGKDRRYDLRPEIQKHIETPKTSL